MEKQVQQLQSQLVSLKARLFDASEAASEQNQQVSELLQKLVDVMHVRGDGNGVSIADIVARATELAEREAAPVEDNVIPFTQPIAPEAE